MGHCYHTHKVVLSDIGEIMSNKKGRQYIEKLSKGCATCRDKVYRLRLPATATFTKTGTAVSRVHPVF
jgi:hypothetical protein